MKKRKDSDFLRLFVLLGIVAGIFMILFLIDWNTSKQQNEATKSGYSVVGKSLSNTYSSKVTSFSKDSFHVQVDLPRMSDTVDLFVVKNGKQYATDHESTIKHSELEFTFSFNDLPSGTYDVLLSDLDVNKEKIMTLTVKKP